MGERYGTACPAPEDLSAWLDSELCDAELETHIAECPACQERLRTYARLDRELIGELGPAPETRDRIKASCLAQLFRGGNLVFYPVWWRLAAAAALLVLAAAIVWDRYQTSQADPVLHSAHHYLADFSLNAPAAAPAPESPQIVAETPAEPELPPPVRIALTEDAATDAPRADDLRVEHLTLVSQGNTEPPAAFRPSAAPARHAADEQVADYVRHVWVVHDSAKALAELQTRFPQKRELLQRLAAEKRPELVLQMTMSDRSLAALVDRFDDLGLKLLSPAAPQPEATDLEFRDQPVQYEVNFVRAGH